MKKIAILCCLRAGEVCTGAACMNSFNTKTKAFSRWQGEELQLGAFLRCSHCGTHLAEDTGMQEKLERLKKENIQAVHVGICARKREEGRLCPYMAESTAWLQENGIPVFWGTHSFFPEGEETL